MNIFRVEVAQYLAKAHSERLLGEATQVRQWKAATAENMAPTAKAPTWLQQLSAALWDWFTPAPIGYITNQRRSIL